MGILLVSGSTRAASSNTAALRTAAAVTPPGVSVVVYQGLAALPAFNPDDDGEGVDLPTSVRELRAALDAADAVLFSTPEYAGALPGAFKNLLDWTVGAIPGLGGKPVGWVNVAPEGRGEGAHAELATVLGYVGADVVPAACLRIPVGHGTVDPDGLVADPAVRAALGDLLAALATARPEPGSA